MHKRHKFYFIVLMEPFQNSHELEVYRRKLGLKHEFFNMKGKIWSFVDECIEVEVLSDEEQQLTLRVFTDNNEVDIVIALVYAKCSQGERLQLREQLYELFVDRQKSWLVGGDFKVVLNEEVKLGGGLPITADEVRDLIIVLMSII